MFSCSEESADVLNSGFLFRTSESLFPKLIWNHLTYMTISVRVHIRVSNDVCNRVKFFSPSNPSIYSATSYCVWDLLPLPKTWLSFSF